MDNVGEGRDTAVVEQTTHSQGRPTTAVEMTVVLGLLLATIGTLTTRVDVVVLALPFLFAAALGMDKRFRDGDANTLRIDVTRRTGARNEREFAYHVHLDVSAATELVHMRITPEGAPVYDVILAPRDVVTVGGQLPIVHSGRQRIVEVAYRLIGVDAGWLTRPTPPVVAERVVDPRIAVLRGIPLPHRLNGLTGTHASARPGDGGEFRDLHRYAAGDRLRRIDWKATARRSQGFGDLYVRRTDATSDATVVLVIDSRDAVAERVEGWSEQFTGEAGLSAMDVAREAAASLAEAAVGSGDRVSLIDLAAHNGVVAAGSGKRHLDRLLRRITMSAPAGVRFSRRRAPIVPAAAIIYVMSTFLDDEVTDIALLWRAAGHRVIAVDVLPMPQLEHSAVHTRTAHRLLMAERRRRIAALRRNGGEIFRWIEDDASPSRAIAMRTLARAGRRR